MSDYVEMMIAAGWITSADIDDEYQKYLRSAPNFADDDDCTYEQWQALRQQWNELNAEYEALNQVYPTMWDEWNHPKRAEGNWLITQMVYIESCLRH